MLLTKEIQMQRPNKLHNKTPQPVEEKIQLHKDPTHCIERTNIQCLYRNLIATVTHAYTQDPTHIFFLLQDERGSFQYQCLASAGLKNSLPSHNTHLRHAKEHGVPCGAVESEEPDITQVATTMVKAQSCFQCKACQDLRILACLEQKFQAPF